MEAKKRYRILMLFFLSLGFPLFISLVGFQNYKKKETFERDGLDLEIKYLNQGIQPVMWSKGSVKIFRFKTQLINHSEDSISFISMTCSFQDMYVVNASDSFNIYPDYHCESNYPITVKLAPNEAYIREIWIKTLFSKKVKPFSMRIGFLLVRSEGINPADDSFKALNTRYSKAPIWSNEIELLWD